MLSVCLLALSSSICKCTSKRCRKCQITTRQYVHFQKIKHINVSVHPSIEEHLTSYKKNVSKLPVLNLIIPILVRIQRASDEQLRPVTLFGAEWVVQSVNAEGGTNQRLRPISGQSCHRSKVTSSLVRKGQAKRKTITLHTLLTQRDIMKREDKSWNEWLFVK